MPPLPPHTRDAGIAELDYGSIVLIDLDFFQSDQAHMLAYLPLGTRACECLVVGKMKPTDPTPSIQILPLMPESPLVGDSGHYPYKTTLIGDGELHDRWYSTKTYRFNPLTYGPKIRQLSSMMIALDKLSKILGNPS